MKPSIRIREICNYMAEGLTVHPSMFVEAALIQFLDEEYEKHKDDIQITQGRGC